MADIAGEDKQLSIANARAMQRLLHIVYAQPQNTHAHLIALLCCCLAAIADPAGSLYGLCDVLEVLVAQPASSWARLLQALCDLPTLELRHAAPVLRALLPLCVNQWASAWLAARRYEADLQHSIFAANSSQRNWRKRWRISPPDFADERLAYLEGYRYVATLAPGDRRVVAFQKAVQSGMFLGLRFSLDELSRTAATPSTPLNRAISEPSSSASARSPNRYPPPIQAITRPPLNVAESPRDALDARSPLQTFAAPSHRARTDPANSEGRAAPRGAHGAASR